MKASIYTARTVSWVLRWMLVCTVALVYLAPQSVAGGDSEPTDELVAEDWVNQIPPGATRQDIRKLLGSPTGIRVFANGFSGGSPKAVKCEFYIRNSVYVFKYDGENDASELVFCGQVPRGEFNEGHVGTMATCYVRYGEDRKAVLEYLQAGDFGKEPAKPNCLRYSGGMYPGLCYPVGGGRFLNILRFVSRTAPEMPYANTNYRVSLVTPGTEPQILYRVQDNWAKFKPHQLTDGALAERERKLRKYGLRKIGGIWSEFLGPSDCNLQLNVGGEHVYYFREGLIIISVSGIGNEPTMIESIQIRRIDGEELDLKDWLETERAEGKETRCNLQLSDVCLVDH